MSDHPETRSASDQELLELFQKADPAAQRAFMEALKGEKPSATDILSMLSGVITDPNVSALIQNLKKAFSSSKQTGSDDMRSLLAFTFFYSSSIYALLLCFFYWKQNNEEKVEQLEEPDDNEN